LGKKKLSCFVKNNSGKFVSKLPSKVKWNAFVVPQPLRILLGFSIERILLAKLIYRI